MKVKIIPECTQRLEGVSPKGYTYGTCVNGQPSDAWIKALESVVDVTGFKLEHEGTETKSKLYASLKENR